MPGSETLASHVGAFDVEFLELPSEAFHRVACLLQQHICGGGVRVLARPRIGHQFALPFLRSQQVETSVKHGKGQRCPCPGYLRELLGGRVDSLIHEHFQGKHHTRDGEYGVPLVFLDFREEKLTINAAPASLQINQLQLLREGLEVDFRSLVRVFWPEPELKSKFYL